MVSWGLSAALSSDFGLPLDSDVNSLSLSDLADDSSEVGGRAGVQGLAAASLVVDCVSRGRQGLTNQVLREEVGHSPVKTGALVFVKAPTAGHAVQQVADFKSEVLLTGLLLRRHRQHSGVGPKA